MKTVLDAFLNKQFTKHYDELSIGLLCGKAGMAVYYAIKGQQSKDDKKLYNKCINDLLSNVSNETPMLIEDGLLGVCLGFNYILTNIEKGNSDYVLSDLDNIVFKRFSKTINEDNGVLSQYIEVLFYLSIRLQCGLKAKERRALFEKLAANIAEDVYANLTADFYSELLPYQFNQPPLLLVDALVRLYTLGIYKDRVWHILDELSYQLLGHIPVLHANRLAMLYTVQTVCNTVADLPPCWAECAEILKTHISADKILNDETLNRQIYFKDGLSGVYLLMLLCNKALRADFFPVDADLYYRRISQSLALKDLKKKPRTNYFCMGLNGFWGMSLLYDYMTKKENNLNK